MARYKVLDPSFINGLLITREMIDGAGPDGYIVDIEPDVSKGGMIAGENLDLVDKADEKKIDDTNTKSLRKVAKDAGITKADDTAVDDATVGQLQKGLQDKALDKI